MDRERLEDIKRTKLLTRIAVLVVIVTIAISIKLSRISVRNVDTTEGIQLLEQMEKKDQKQIEGKIITMEATDEETTKEDSSTNTSGEE